MWRLLLALLLLLPLALAVNTNTNNSNNSNESGVVCQSMELRKLADFAKLRNCSLVVGYVSIANVELPSDADLAQLRSAVEEITDYLLVYRCNGLLTLEQVFPRLRLIRGKALLFDRYALVVYENRNLRELGLLQLLRVQSGNIRVESNPMLCFVDTVDWIYLLSNSTEQRYSLKNNKSPNHCPVCGGLAAGYSCHSNASHCWSLEAPQQFPTPHSSAGCPSECGANGCDATGNCCQRSCITGCSAQNCSLCANFNSHGRCVDQCTFRRFQLHKRECKNNAECRQLGRIPLSRGSVCVDECPDNQKALRNANGTLYCELSCKGVFHIQRAADLLPLQDCVIINGSLIVKLWDIKEKIVGELEQALQNVKEITGYLKIQGSAQLMSLGFLRNLDTIRGDQLIENKYALFVVDNDHLEEIWAASHQVVAIQHGSLFFHLNPRLCYEKIQQLESSLKSGEKITIANVSPNSNGERVICGNAVRDLNATIEEFNSTAVRISVNLMKPDEMEILLGYTYHYKEAPQKNVTMYDGRHGCGHDEWLMDVSHSKNCRHIIGGLKPYTQYAFFVKTLTRTDYHMQVDAYSRIHYFRTKPSRPSPVSRIYGNSQKTTEIKLHWWPPRRPNGSINKYLISYEIYNGTKPDAGSKSHFSSRLDNQSECKCNVREPYYSGPQPEDENYYNKEQVTYDDALPNLIYVSRREVETKQKTLSKVKDFADLIAPPATPAYVNLSESVESTTRSVMVNKTNGTVIDDEDRAKRYELYRQNLDLKLLQEQDTGIAAFPIVQPTPLCADAHASVSQQLEDKCVVEEDLSGIQVPGTKHFYSLTKLKPDQLYRIEVRACVADVVNGCSKPKETLVKTISQDLDNFIHGCNTL